ncbi:MAG: ABC transporter ATP-binding protein [Pseudomonadota bacterium]
MTSGFLPPRAIPRTGDNTPAATLGRYLWRMSGWHQAGAGALAVVLALLSFAPVEVQRRLIDDAIAGDDTTLLLWLGGLYLGLLAATQIVKAVLLLYRAWLSESAARYCRAHLMQLHGARQDDGAEARPGEAVAIVNTEVDKLTGFVGDGPSQAIQFTALLLGGTAYMLWIDPVLAGVGLVLLIPQALWAPLMQRRLNRLIRQRVRLMRLLGERVSDSEADPGTHLTRIYRNRLSIAAWKALTKAGLGLMNGLAPLSVLVVGGWLAIAGETSLGVIVAFVSGFQRLAEPLRALIRFYREYAQARVQHDMIARWM